MNRRSLLKSLVVLPAATLLPAIEPLEPRELRDDDLLLPAVNRNRHDLEKSFRACVKLLPPWQRIWANRTMVVQYGCPIGSCLMDGHLCSACHEKHELIGYIVTDIPPVYGLKVLRESAMATFHIGMTARQFREEFVSASNRLHSYVTRTPDCMEPSEMAKRIANIRWDRFAQPQLMV